MSVRSYRDLIAWQKAMDLSVAVFRLTETFPRREVYVLAAHLRKTSISIPSNIAEGQGRGATNDYLRFLRIARGSVQELETQLTLAQRLGYLANDRASDLFALSAEVSRLVSGLAKSLGGTH
jgi:four helix bundle protein